MIETLGRAEGRFNTTEKNSLQFRDENCGIGRGVTLTGHGSFYDKIKFQILVNH